MRIAIAILMAAPILAHDMWIEPATFTPAAGEIVPLRLKVGQDLIGDLLPRNSEWIKDFVVEDAAGRKPVVGRDGMNPAGLVRAAEPGMLVIGYNSNPSVVEETPEKFNHYLKEEGLESIAALRARRGETDAKVRELFLRCSKSLVLSGAPDAKQGDKRLGFPLELVAEKNPYLLRAGEELPVRLTYEGKPLAGTLVVAMNRLNPMEKLRARTGKDGRVRFALRPGGMWLIKAVYMIAAPGGSNADWQSWWASLTFAPPATTLSVSK